MNLDLEYDAPGFVQDVADGCTLSVRAHPGARRNDVTGLHAGAVKISITTPPTDGRANEALIEFLAALLRVPRARLRFRPRSFLLRCVERLRYLTDAVAFGATVIPCPSSAVIFTFVPVTVA